MHAAEIICRIKACAAHGLFPARCVWHGKTGATRALYLAKQPVLKVACRRICQQVEQGLIEEEGPASP